ncbi:MAG: MSCRAMM family adhesin SdrC, partial [Gammaproteobacteria bacterium]|nr:MSCRAMM family adhesin SdrC [Gammaproteobacteria bacterium]
GATNSTTIADGSKDPDGSGNTTSDKDGSTNSTTITDDSKTPDGSGNTTSDKDGTTNSTTIADGSGNTTSDKDDKTNSTTIADGSVNTTSDKDGSTNSTTIADGSKTPDGSVNTTSDKDGSTNSTTIADGSKDPDGSGNTTSDKDGSTNSTTIADGSGNTTSDKDDKTNSTTVTDGSGKDMEPKEEPLPPPLFPLLDTDDDGKLEIWHAEQLAALATTNPNPVSNSSSSPDDNSTASLLLNASYELTADISLSSYNNWRPIGNLTHPFTGDLDGNGYSISGITTDGYEHAGLFGVMHFGSINNLTVEVETIIGSLHSGALVGLIEDSYISNVEISLGDVATIAMTQNVWAYTSTGGMIGSARRSYLHGSRILGTGSIRANSDRVTRYSYNVGGLVGFTEGGNYNNTFLNATLELSAGNAIDRNLVAMGSLIGWGNSLSLTETDIYFSGSISAQSYENSVIVGGIIGRTYRIATVDDLDAIINSSISAIIHGSSYSPSAAGFIGDSGESTSTNIDIHIIGDIIASAPTSRGRASVGGFISDTTQHDADNVRLLIDGDLIATSAYAEIGGYLSFVDDSQTLDNISVVINGNIEILAHNSNSAPSSFGGVSSSTEDAYLDNVTVTINGDISFASIGSSIKFGSFMGRVSACQCRNISDSYVLINGTVDLSVTDADTYVGGFIGRQRGLLIVDSSYARITGGMSINSTSSPDSLTQNNVYVGEIVGELEDSAHIHNSYFAMDKPLGIYVDGILAPQHFNGAIGINTGGGSLTLEGSYHTIDVLGL